MQAPLFGVMDQKTLPVPKAVRTPDQQASNAPVHPHTFSDTNNETVGQAINQRAVVTPPSPPPKPNSTSLRVCAQVEMVFEIVKQKGMVKLDKICQPVRTKGGGGFGLVCVEVACYR